MSEALDRVSQVVGEEDLSRMVLERQELPQELQEFQPARDGVLDNETMAAHGFPGSTTGETRATGRITGYLREFIGATDPVILQTGSNVIAATVVHLFRDKDEVSRWMVEKFLGEFQRSVGQELGEDQQLISADQLQFDGFADEAVGLRTVQTTRAGLVSSTIVDLRVGRLLGVAYLVALGDVERTQLVSQMGLGLEKKMVGVLLGSV